MGVTGLAGIRQRFGGIEISGRRERKRGLLRRGYAFGLGLLCRRYLNSVRTSRARTSPRRFAAWRVGFAILATSAFIVCFDNGPFWASVSQASDADSHRFGILLTMFALVFCTLNVVLALAFGRRLFKLLGCALLVSAAVVGFYMSKYGVLVDASMIRSVVDTDFGEASPLLTRAFFLHLLLFGVIPAAVLARVNLGTPPWHRDLCVRGVVVIASVAALLGTVYGNYRAVSFFTQDHRQVRLLVNPAYPIYSYIQYLVETHAAAQAAVAVPVIDEHARFAAGTSSKPRLGVLVVGETARADRFSLNGYERNTNLYSPGKGVINFPHVSSCGTSTADSIPCMFSSLGRSEFDHVAGAGRENLFSMFDRLGIDVLWRDNNTGCKDICDPAHAESFSTGTVKSAFCDSTGCFDEALLEDLQAELAENDRDYFLVLHQRGSHGPAYFESTPWWAKRYLPECDLPNLRDCSSEALNNAYDNTILYTDYFLTKVIETLEGFAADYDVAMLYVSDHGESLGEGGIFLHGFPYRFAPPEQTRIPMLFWASNDFYAHQGVSRHCLEVASGNEEYSHDSVFHTVAAIFDVQTRFYDPRLDFLAPCRNRELTADAR